MAEFIFTRKEKEECLVVVDSPLESDFSSGESLVNKVMEISGVEISIVKKEKKTNQKRVFVGTLPESPSLQKILVDEKIIIRPNDLIGKSSKGGRRQHFFLEDLGEQGFIAYRSGENTLILAGGSPKGTFYAVQTLINHLYFENDNLKVDGLHTEKFPIFNRPAILSRMVCTNIGGPDHIGRDQWAKEWQREGQYDYKGFIDWLAQFKITHLNIWLFELAFGIAYPSTKFPECVNKYHPNVKKEFIGEMIKYAHEKFIDVSIVIDFPDFFTGVLRHHPELGAKQLDPSQFPSDEEWEIYQRTGEKKKGTNFRGEFGTVCASKPEVMAFWEEYLEEVFNRYPGLDGIIGQFAEDIGGICSCDKCQKNFFKLQWKYFRRMTEIAQKDRPERKIYNCASAGDVEILRHQDEIKNFIHLDWHDTYLWFDYGRACPHGKWYLLHHPLSLKRWDEKWHEFEWKRMSQILSAYRFQGIVKRGVSYIPSEKEYFAFGEFAWNPELRVENYADIYVKMAIREKDEQTAALYSHWIKARGYSIISKQLNKWQSDKAPFSAKKIDREYPHLLREELAIVSSLIRKIKGKNKIVKEIEEEFIKINTKVKNGM